MNHYLWRNGLPAILRFPPAPDFLEWLRGWGNDTLEYAHVEEVAGRSANAEKMGEDSKRIKDLYSYFRWSHAYHNTDPDSDEHYVAEGLLHKYYHHILQMDEVHPMVAEQIAESERMLKESNEEIRRRKTARV